MDNSRPEDDARLEYARLKERMKADLKQLRKSVRKGKPIDPELVGSFCADARRMTTYPGKGDECYLAFCEHVSRLESGAAQEDRETLAQAIDALRKMEKECHSRFR